MNPMVTGPTPKVVRRRWGQLPLTPIIPSTHRRSPQRMASSPTRPAVITTDALGVITGFNPMAEKLLGHHAGDLIGTASPEIFCEADDSGSRERASLPALAENRVPGFAALVDRVGSDSSSDEEWTFLRADGVEVRALVSLTRMQDASARTLGYVITAMPAE